jgi:hypothetical protein
MKKISLLSLSLWSLPGLLTAALDTNPITNGDFEADLGSTVGSVAGNFDNTASGWFGENGTAKGDFIQWDGSGGGSVPDDANGEVWGGVAINENDSNNPGAYYQAIGTNEDNFEVLVSMTVGDRSNFFFQNIVVSLYSGNVTGANGSSLTTLGATLLDSATITNSVFTLGDANDNSIAAQTATISGLALNTGTTGVAGESLWLEISSSVPGSEVWKYQAFFDDVSVIPEPSAYGLIAGCLALTSIMLRRRR